MAGRRSGRGLNLYIESSAVLAWWLDQPGAAKVRSEIEAAAVLATSDLTRAECCRAFQRGRALGQLSARQADILYRRAEDFWGQCHGLAFDPEVVETACQTLPAEPVRTLDALHLGFWRLGTLGMAPLAILSLDARLRAAAQAMGATVVPEANS
jgi:predicted nucleic acid-binding protein